jgi:hypothetical protein
MKNKIKLFEQQQVRAVWDGVGVSDIAKKDYHDEPPQKT